MKKIVISLVVCFIFLSCRSGEEVLAVFDGGVVKRKDFREFYPNHDLTVDNNTTSLKYQSSVLETLAVQSIVEIDSEKKGYTKTDLFKSIMDLKEKQILVNLYRKNFIEKEVNSLDMEIVSGQMVYIKKDINGNPNSAKADQVLNDLKNLKSDKEIDAFVSKETDEEGRKPISGYLEPQCMNCSEENILREILLEAYQNNSIKTFTKKEINGDLFVYRIIEIKKIRAKDLESYISKRFKEFQSLAKEFKATAPENQKALSDNYLADEGRLENEARMIRDRYVEQLQAKIWNDEYERISKQSGIEFSKEMGTLTEDQLVDTTPIYTKGGKTYTLGDLKSEYAKVNMKPDTYVPQAKELLYFFNSAILPVSLMSDNADVKNLKSSEKFESQLALWRKNITWSFFVRDIQNMQMNITDQEVKDTYEAGKLYTYSAPSKANPEKREPIPFNQVKDKIKEDLRTSKLKAEMQKQIEKLKNDYHLTLNSDKLKAGSI
ncbi:MAG TPA: hypothetical protein PK079_05840 [Leptospiraceae bacterium]|nr:hypothetical protein [Leptospiraceae bacterium]HMW05698.1 hypothetical protein [Leptospiraceae bacterium]HMX34877.1 hypothetical protein [Leptospiraceae bacterium]HMY30269.1 hypothetical protein [Leptospiraceae bacterium]HNA07152.1 hypothetical protein [Leptospiraceae bacterium]